MMDAQEGIKERYNSVLRELGKLQLELRIEKEKRLETIQRYQRFVELVCSAPEPLLRAPYSHIYHNNNVNPTNNVNNNNNNNEDLPSSSSSSSPSSSPSLNFKTLSKRNSIDSRKEKRKSFRWSKKVSTVHIPVDAIDNLVWGTVVSFLDYFSLLSVSVVSKRFYDIVHTAAQHIIDEHVCLYLWHKRLDAVPKMSPWTPSQAHVLPLFVFPSFGFSFKSKEKKTAKKVHKAIEEDIKIRRRTKIRTYLIIGPPGSGKSAMLYNHLLTFNNLEEYKQLYIDYTIQSMKEFLAKNDHATLLHTNPEDVTLQSIPNLWKDDNFQKVYFENLLSENSSSNAHYFFENAARIAEPNYIPTRTDLRHLKVKETSPFLQFTKTVGDNFIINLLLVQNFHEKVVFYTDLFSDVDWVYLCIPLNEYDHDKEAYIHQVLDGVFFNNKLILIFTKRDIFEANVKSGKINEYTRNIIGDSTDMSSIKTKMMEHVKANFTFRKCPTFHFVNNLEDEATSLEEPADGGTVII